MKDHRKQSRRSFIRHAAVTAGSAAVATSASPVLGANDRIRVGFIGVGNRGSQLLSAFMQNRDVQVAAFADCYEPYLSRDRSKVHARFLDELGGRIPQMGENFSSKVDVYTDFRELINRDDIDAVCIATPDHWHAYQAIMAMESGKDVYVEKPLTIALKEGRKMIDVAERTKRVNQVGLHRRASSIYHELAPKIQGGMLGKVTVSRAYRISDMSPLGIGKASHESPPDGFDWDMWLGPRAERPFQYNIHPYRFRWWKNYSSQMGNWGVHYFDTIRWMLGEEAPIAVTTTGGNYSVDDDRTIPDTSETTFEFASGSILVFGVYEGSGGRAIQGEIEIHGTKGTLSATERGYTVTPAKPGQFQTWENQMEPIDRRLDMREDNTFRHVRNFLDCMKTREECYCSLETGHRSTSFALLANIAYERKKRLEWDAKNERFTNDNEANKLLDYKYRKPWELS